MKREISYRTMSHRDFQKEAWVDLKKPTAWPGIPLLCQLCQSRSFHTGTSTIPVLLETFLTTFFPGTQIGKHAADCPLPLHLKESRCRGGRGLPMPASAKCPFLIMFSVVLQLVLAQEIYNIHLQTVGDFSSQLARTGNNSPEVNIEVVCQEVWKNAHENKSVSCCVIVICNYNRNASI